MALLHKFVYEFRANNACIIQDRTALVVNWPWWQELGMILEKSNLKKTLFSNEIFSNDLKAWGTFFGHYAFSQNPICNFLWVC